MVNAFPRVQEIVVPILRNALPEGVKVSTWIDDIDHRTYPLVNVRRVGGYRDFAKPYFLDRPVIELTVIHDEGLVEAEELYSQCLDALLDSWQDNKVVDRGHIGRVRETMGMTQFSSLFQDTFRVQGLIELSVRSKREES